MRMTPTRRLFALPAIILLLAACSSAGGPAPTQVTAPTVGGPSASPVESSGSATATAPTPVASPVDAPTASEVVPPVLDQAWATAELTDAATGEPFRIADLAGRVVILETMAIWCSNCFAQQGHVYDALTDLDPAKVAYVLIDIDPNETPAALAAYRERHGFTGTYAVADRELARALATDFGDQVLNPPSTPMVIIGADGRVTLTAFGSKSPGEIVALAEEHGA
jgi:thiol-disulfide isomerase/thioredoxin